MIRGYFCGPGETLSAVLKIYASASSTKSSPLSLPVKASRTTTRSNIEFVSRILAVGLASAPAPVLDFLVRLKGEGGPLQSARPTTLLLLKPSGWHQIDKYRHSRASIGLIVVTDSLG
jgi:hypothetical protein